MKLRHLFYSLIGGFLLAASSSAATLQIDFSDNTGSYSGSQSPGHAAGDVSGTTWNTAVGDVASGLLWDDGTAAAGLQVDVGGGPPTTTIDWDLNLNESSDSATIPFYDTSLMRDWHYTSGNANLGARVNGLDAGIYRVYALIRESNQLARTYEAAIGVNVNAWSDAGVVEVTPITDASGATTWTDGQNYASTDVTVSGPSDWVTVVVDPINAQWGTLEGLQIVAIPEPSSAVLFGLAGLALCGVRRRR